MSGGRCVVRQRLDWQHGAECSCGWRGPDRYKRDEAVADRIAHVEHRGVVAGEWYREQQWGPIFEIQAADGSTLVFDPPNMLWPAGGMRVRIEDYDTERPILALERFDRAIERHPMRKVATASPAGMVQACAPLVVAR